AQVVLGALGLREPALRPPAGALSTTPPDPAERLVAALAEQDLLLILDNCEHVIAEAATLARRLLSACPLLTVLATSREPLGITGEHLVPLAPLPTPSLGAGTTPHPPRDAAAAGDPLGYPAVRLFADRAAAVRPGFVLAPDTMDPVLRICAALDGLPLAIELAAARVRTLSVAEIASRLTEHGRFRLLSRGDRTAAARHQTLYATVEWSWSLLDAEEQTLARRFAVFTGGAGLEAVERVCGEPGAGRLADLVDKSLVETDGERYHMLETIRLFCLERLAEAGEEERLRQAHATWFLELARRADEHLCRSEQLHWLALLSADNANLQAALRWSVTHDQPTAWRLVAALAMYWWLSGRRGQAFGHAVGLLDSAAGEPPAGLAEEYVLAVLHAVPDAGSPHWDRARTIVGSLGGPMRHRFGVALWGMITGPPENGTTGRRVLDADPWSRALSRLGTTLLVLHNGSVVEAERELASVLAEFHALGERWGTAQALDWLAVLAGWRGDWARAMELWKQALDRLEELGALDEQVDVLGRRADARLRAGDVAGARADYARVGDLDRRLGRPELTAWVHLRLGNLARLEGDLDEASRRLGAALAGVQFRGFTADATRAHVLTALGRLAEATGDVSEAARRHEQALAAVLESPLSADLADVAEGLAGLALAGRRPDERTPGAERAAQLLGAAVALRGTSVAGEPDVARIAAAATEILGPEAFAAAFSRGASMSGDKAREALRAATP
ncbi:tetratricopeptide repeat protein, partial [Nonomuraea mesophila]